MSIGTRVLFVEGNRITRMSVRRFERLWNGDPDATMPECAGRRVRCAMVYVEIYNRRPVRILHIDYMVLPFDSGGHLDPSERRRQNALAIESISGTLGSVSKPVVQIGPYLAGRRYRDEFKWKPTEEQAESLDRLALEW